MGEPHADLAGTRILLLEDEVWIALLGQEILTDAGAAEVIVAANVAEAFRLLEQPSKIDAALIDIKLGTESHERSGFELGAALMKRNIPFIFVSGLGPTSQMPEEFRKVPYLSKPYIAEALLATIAAAIAKAKNKLIQDDT